jgi:hypothetical protein
MQQGESVSRGKKIIIIFAVLAIAGAVAAYFVWRLHIWQPQLSVIRGAVIRHDADVSKELPITDVVVTGSHGAVTVNARTDASGFFELKFPEPIWPGQTVDVKFRNDDYEPLDMDLKMAYRSTMRRLVIAAMEPIPQASRTESGAPLTVISNIRIRYTVHSQQADNIGSVVKTFQVVNHGNVPCRRQAPCSPDGEWKAATNSVKLDAGQDNEFRNVRASCIAGPCPFTRMDSSGFAQGGRVITASALNWSDTATFLVEAEVFHTALASSVRRSYPVIYDRALNFTLPESKEGLSIEADVNGQPMIFPLGPELYLSWATCTSRETGDERKSTVYRCEMKPGYRVQ